VTYVCLPGVVRLVWCPDVLVGLGFGDACPMALDVKAARKTWVTGLVAHD
jgi:hypothetical protein